MKDKTEIKIGYKKTKLGWIPKEWEIKKLGDLGSFSKGKGISKKELTKTGFPCIRYGEIYTSHDFFIKNFYSFIDNKTAKQSKAIKKNDVLFAGSGETLEDIGKSVAYLGEEEAYVGGDIIILSTKGVDVLFLVYLLNSNCIIKQRIRLGQGHSIVHIYANYLKELLIPYPSFPEQQKIAQILSTWDSAIEKTEQLIAAKEKLKKGLMYQLLSGKKRLIGFNDNWEKVKLKDIVVFINGKAHENHISTNGYIVVNSKFVSSEGEIKKYSNKCFCPSIAGDILMVMSDVPNGKAIAKCFYVMKNGVYTVNQRVCILRTKNTNSKFLYYLINRNPYYLIFDDGIKQTNLRKDDVLGFSLLIPAKLEEQQKITSVLSTADKEIEIFRKQLKNLKEQKKGLMQVLLTGRKRVKTQ